MRATPQSTASPEGWEGSKVKKQKHGDFPGGAVVKNPPADARDTVLALVREDPTCRGAAKPVRHNYWACALEPWATTTEASAPRARAPQQEKPLQWKARAPQWRVAPAQRN